MMYRVLSVSLCLLAPSAAASQSFPDAMAGWFAGIQQSISAIRVDTRQHSLSSEQVSNADMASTEAFANVLVETNQAIAARRAVERYESMHNSHTIGLCNTVEAGRMAAQAQVISGNVSAELADFERDWLLSGGDRVETMVQLQGIRRTALCTESERAMDLCIGNEVFGVPPAGDSDAGPFLIRRTYGSSEVKFGTLFIDNVAPLPTIQRAQDAVRVDELIERARARQETGLATIARASLGSLLLRGMEGGTSE